MFDRAALLPNGRLADRAIISPTAYYTGTATFQFADYAFRTRHPAKRAFSHGLFFPKCIAYSSSFQKSKCNGSLSTVFFKEIFLVE